MLTTRTKNTEFSGDEKAAEAIVSQTRGVPGDMETFLSSEEVLNLVGSELELASANSPSDVGKRRPHLDVLYDITQHIDTGYEKPYVNINGDKCGESFKLFANIGNSDSFAASFTEVPAKAVSTLPRSDIDPEGIVNELKGIRDPRVTWDKGE